MPSVKGRFAFRKLGTDFQYPAVLLDSGQKSFYERLLPAAFGESKAQTGICLSVPFCACASLPVYRWLYLYEAIRRRLERMEKKESGLCKGCPHPKREGCLQPKYAKLFPSVSSCLKLTNLKAKICWSNQNFLKSNFCLKTHFTFRKKSFMINLQANHTI